MKNKRTVRPATNKLIQLLEEGALDPMTVLVEALSYMPEDDVADMATCAGFFECLEEEDEC